MRRLTVFNSVSLDGYFTGPNGDLSWAHSQSDIEDPEWEAFVGGNAASGGVLLFGRKTYEMMKQYWPTPEAAKKDPIVAKQMNALPKIVFSRTLKEADWDNTRLAKGDLVDEVRKLKTEDGHDLVILGSGTIVSQLAKEGLIDEYQLVTIPVAIGEGRTMFEGMDRKLGMRRTKSRTFENGNILTCYQPMSEEKASQHAA